MSGASRTGARWAPSCAIRECVADRGAFIRGARSPPDAETERIALIEQQRRIRVYVGGAADGRDDGGGATAPVAGLERAADDALLHPLLVFCELAVRGEAGELGAGAGAARRAVVGVPRAQHEVTRIGAGKRRRPEELDVVDLGVALGVDRG